MVAGNFINYSLHFSNNRHYMELFTKREEKGTVLIVVWLNISLRLQQGFVLLL